MDLDHFVEEEEEEGELSSSSSAKRKKDAYRTPCCTSECEVEEIEVRAYFILIRKVATILLHSEDRAKVSHHVSNAFQKILTRFHRIAREEVFPYNLKSNGGLFMTLYIRTRN